MSKIMTDKDGPILGIETSLEMFQKLKFESARLESGWHPYDAFNFLVTAWHLFHDYVKSDDPRSLCRMKRQKNRLPSEMVFLIDIVRDLANGSKHFQLDDKSLNRRRVAETHSGEEVGWYQFFFHENIPAVTVEENWYFSIRTLNNLTIRYFEWVFDDHCPLDKFPQDLIDAIDYCNIANRKNKTTPPLWNNKIESAYKD